MVMKYKILNVVLVITSLLGYMEWGGGKSAFLFSAELEVLKRLFTNAKSVVHPLTIIPLIGQLLLFVTLFQEVPGKALTYTGMISLGILLLLLFLIGVSSGNIKMAVASAPFLITSILIVMSYRKEKKVKAEG